jgi:hypothetical protein
MTAETHSQLASFIWSICNLLRGPYKRNEYRKVILPLTVLRRFDCLLAPTKAAVLEEYSSIKKKPETVVRSFLQKITRRPFYNLGKFDFQKLLDDPNQLAPNLVRYINDFSPNVRAIVERFGFEEHIQRMAQKNLLFLVIKAFAKLDLSSDEIDNVQMGYVFEELIRIGAEQANEEAGEHFTPREVIKLMVNLLLSPEKDLTHSHVVKTIYDPACGTGGMLSVSEQYIHELNSEAKPMLYGQDWNDDAWAVCKSDMLIKGEEADNIILGDTFTEDGFDRMPDDKKWMFDYMLANPPFGVEWKQQQRFIEKERDTLGYQGRFGAGTPRVNDGSLLFLQHMLSKMRDPKKAASEKGSVLFSCIWFALHRFFKSAPARMICQIIERTCQPAHMPLGSHLQPTGQPSQSHTRLLAHPLRDDALPPVTLAGQEKLLFGDSKCTHQLPDHALGLSLPVIVIRLLSPHFALAAKLLPVQPLHHSVPKHFAAQNPASTHLFELFLTHTLPGPALQSPPVDATISRAIL